MKIIGSSKWFKLTEATTEGILITPFAFAKLIASLDVAKRRDNTSVNANDAVLMIKKRQNCKRGDGVCYVKGRSRNAPPVEQTRKRRVPTLPTLGCQAVNVFHPSIRNYRGCHINDVVTAFIISRWPRKHLRNFRRGDVGRRSLCLDVIGAEKRVSRVTGE